MKVKICGITSLEDALMAIKAGADLLGFNFYPPSPRAILPMECARIVNGILERDLRVRTVGVFVNASAGFIQSILDGCGLDLAQLCGDEAPELLQALGGQAFKALRPTRQEQIEEAMRFYPCRAEAPAWLVDCYRPGQYGGTGQVADWSLAGTLAKRAPILLAGGLNPDNVALAIQQVRPWGVDVASGVESAPGRKDSRKVAAFVRTVHSFEWNADNAEKTQINADYLTGP